MCAAVAETLLLFVDFVLLVELQSRDVTPGQRSAFFRQVFKRLFTWRDYVKLRLSQSAKFLTSVGDDKHQRHKIFY